MSATPRRRGRTRDESLPARRREQILEGASRLFARFGYADADLQVLADELGVGKGTLYRYFRSKSDLFLATVESGVERLRQVVDAALFSTGDPLQGFDRAVRAYLGFFDAHPEYIELFIQERAAFRDRQVPRYFARQANDCAEQAEMLQQLITANQFRAVDAEAVFGVVGDLLYGTIFSNYLSGRQVPFEKQADQILDVVLYGLLSERERKRRRRGST